MPQVLAVLGAGSQIARDFVLSIFAARRRCRLLLYTSDVKRIEAWWRTSGFIGDVVIDGYDGYGQVAHDAVINFVGVGSPARASQMGSSILGITQRFDQLVMDQMIRAPSRRYIFISSGAVYGKVFDAPATDDSKSIFPLSSIGAEDWYGLSKFLAEVNHRSRADLPIIDLRVFNYFSRRQDLTSRFFLTDVVSAIVEKRSVTVSSQPIVRDFLCPEDFYQLVSCLLDAPPVNAALDCYSAAPVSKFALLDELRSRYGLDYVCRSEQDAAVVNATGDKANYFSLSRKAASFGYVPRYTSLAGVLAEVSAILQQ